MKLADNKIKTDQETLDISDEELEYLYEKAVIELETLDYHTKVYHNIMSCSVFGSLIMSIDNNMTENFFYINTNLIREYIPAILLGDYEKCKDLDLDEKDFNSLRFEIYKNLKERY